MSALSLMRHRCTIRRNTSENVDGVIRSEFTDLATNVRCLIQEKAGRVVLSPNGANLEYDAVCFLPPGTDIGPRGNDDVRDQVVQTFPATGVIYLTTHVAERSGMGNHLTAYLKRFQLEPESE